MNSAQSQDPSTAFRYIVKQGDTLTDIAKRFSCKDGKEIYDFEFNKLFRDKNPDPGNISADSVVFIPAPYIRCGSSGKTNTSIAGIRFLIDGHMHIQSNNCSPMPLQWGILKSFIEVMGRYAVNSHPKLNRKKIAALGAKLMIEPDPVSIILSLITEIELLPVLGFKSAAVALEVLFATSNIMRFGKVGRLPSDLIGSLCVDTLANTDLRPDDQWIIKEPNENIDAVEAGKRAELQKMNQQNSLAYKQFIDHTGYYFQGARKWRMNCALTFDLTAAHYWGKFGIPVTIERSDNDLCYINDFVTAGFRNDVTSGNYTRHLFPSTIVPMDTMNTRFLYARALENEPVLSFADQFRLSGPVLGTDGFPFLDFEENSSAGKHCSSLVNKSFVHLVEPLPKEEKAQMEHYHERQLFLSEGAAARHPLEILLFYHYDPRIHFAGNDAAKQARVEALAQSIVKDHAFFTYKFDTAGGRSYGNSSIKNRIVLQPDGKLNSTDTWKKILGDNQHSNQSVFDRLRQKPESKSGIYWGIKMYPKLGYAPDDFKTYPQLKELYATCMNLKAPITAHCAEGGMSIADYFNYLRYDLKLAKELYYPTDSALSFAHFYAAPENWKRVLSDFPSLKLCLAHFGSIDLWKEIGSLESMDKKFPAPPSGHPSKYTHEEKLARKYHIWIKPIAEMIQGKKFENLYTDLAFFYIHEDTREKFVENLAFLLNKYPNLKERLLLGSDWYMVEVNDFMLGNYSFHLEMFEAMRLLSEKVGYDAWHQFGVVNQLRFLGILDESGKEMKVEVEQLKEYVERLKELINTKDWSSLSFCDHNNINESYIDANTLGLLSDITSTPNIPKSDSIKSENKLLIISKGTNEHR